MNIKKAAKKPPLSLNIFYACLRLAKAVKARRPEPNNQTAAGTGTVGVGLPTVIFVMPNTVSLL